ncbi:MAG: hypothetical protein HDS13_03560 [Bacteroides sp.]|nr:hypothetical protein [Bacteroides sp.]
MLRHRREVKYMLRRDKGKCVVRFNEYCFGEATDLSDSHYQSEYVYRECFEIIERGWRKIVMGDKSFAFELNSFAMLQRNEDRCYRGMKI